MWQIDLIKRWKKTGEACFFLNLALIIYNIETKIRILLMIGMQVESICYHKITYIKYKYDSNICLRKIGLFLEISSIPFLYTILLLSIKKNSREVKKGIFNMIEYDFGNFSEVVTCVSFFLALCKFFFYPYDWLSATLPPGKHNIWCISMQPTSVWIYWFMEL